MLGIQAYSVILFNILHVFLDTTAASHPLFIFGDAFFDAGNNNYINVSTFTKANTYPYGVSYFPSPTGRFSNGRLISDFLANHANLPFIAPYLQPDRQNFYDGVNFASGGSGALSQTFQGGVIDLQMQLNNYKQVEGWFRNKLGDVETSKRFADAVYLMGFGTNDYAYLYLTNSSYLTAYTKSQVVGMVIGNITSVVTEVYHSGGRKFGFLNVPAFNCLPGLKISTADGECIKEASTYAIMHNDALLQTLDLLGKQLPGFKYSVFDFYTCVQQRIEHPSDYGYKETRAACCGSGKIRGEFSCGGKRGIKEFELCENRDEYVFWDSFHLTEKIYQQCSDEMWSSPNNTLSYGSYSIKDLYHLP